MSDPRIGATATLLQNGKVLIAGGNSDYLMGDSVLASAELYDPQSGSFSPTGSMTMPRAEHTATLLSDGRVLVAGGWGCSKGGVNCGDVSLASAELYDPVTGSFSPTGSMSVDRPVAAATRLRDGRVLVIGGWSPWPDLYDPKSGKFARCGTMPATLANWGGQIATPLANGKVLVTGPSDDGSRAVLFDPATCKFAPTSYHGRSVSGYYSDPTSATLLGDGSVLLELPDVPGDSPASLESYDPASGIFASAPSMTIPGTPTDPTATLLHDGRVLFAGGWGPNGNDTIELADVYDPRTGTHLTCSMVGPRGYHMATLLADGDVLIAGGSIDNAEPLSTAELFKP